MDEINGGTIQDLIDELTPWERVRYWGWKIRYAIKDRFR